MEDSAGKSDGVGHGETGQNALPSSAPLKKVFALFQPGVRVSRGWA